MDPFTQGALGAAATLSWRRPKKATMYLVAGWLGGMAADLDVLISSKSDPILFLEYHRHFTHSLFFIPIGGAVVGFLLWLLLFRFQKLPLKEVILAATVGYATHALLDACTTYGTLLLWPFSSMRVAWNAIAIIDPIYTGVLSLGILLTMFFKSQAFVRIGLAVSFVYLGFGVYMREQAEAAGHKLAANRSHQPVRLESKPTVLNLFLWRIVYEYEGRFFVDAVHLWPWSVNRIYEGTSVEKLSKPPEQWPAGATISKDFERFRWFSNDYLMWHPTEEGVIGDVRYAMLPNRIEPLWGIKADLERPDEHVQYITARDFAAKDQATFWRMLWGQPD